MGYKITLNEVDRQRLARLLRLAEHVVEEHILVVDGLVALDTLRIYTYEDVALAQRLAKMLEDTNEYVVISDRSPL